MIVNYWPLETIFSPWKDSPHVESPRSASHYWRLLAWHCDSPFGSCDPWPIWHSTMTGGLGQLRYVGQRQLHVSSVHRWSTMLEGFVINQKLSSCAARSSCWAIQFQVTCCWDDPNPWCLAFSGGWSPLWVVGSSCPKLVIRWYNLYQVGQYPW